MELFDVIALIGVLGVISSIVFVLIFRIVPRKTPKRVAEDSVTRLIQANSRLTEEYEARQKAMNKSMQSELNRLRKEMEGNLDEDGNPKKESVPWEVIAAGAEQMGIPSMMLMPFKKQILEYTKGMSIEEIQQSAGQLKGILGGQRPKQDTEDQSGITFA